MDFLSFLSQHVVMLDGGMGTLLQAQGLRPGELPERWCITKPEAVTAVHRAYFDAGSNVVATNTFGANILKYSEAELSDIITAAVGCARRAAAECERAGERFVALDIGPTGRLLAPLGDLDVEDAIAVFRKTAALGAAAGVDLILVETMNDAYETRAALIGVREACDLPIVVTNAYGADGRLTTGATPEAMAVLCEALGAAAVGANCSLGPRELAPVVRELLATADIPVVLKPNAGLPRTEGGCTVYDVSPTEFAEAIAPLVGEGVRAVGGCCGTTPDYIAALTAATEGLAPRPIEKKSLTAVTSYTHAVRFGEGPILIGERINPTGKRRFREALLSGDTDYILREAVAEEEAGAQILDVNVGLPELCEATVLAQTVGEIQAISALPLCIDTASPAAMERALRRYNGKPLLNSVNGKQESLDAVLPLAKKYGAAVIALTLDEGGIPETAEGRVAIAERIIREAARYGIDKKDIIFDTLTLTVSADPTAARTTLSALREIRTRLGCHTSLGVSNVSFGLPARDGVNATFFAMALEAGLSAAIMNPHSAAMMQVYYSARALLGQDPSCAAYIKAAEGFATVTAAKAAPSITEGEATHSPLYTAILRGLREGAGAAAEQALAERAPLDVVNEDVIPALNEVGAGYEAGRIYLPALLISAEAAGVAFERIKARLTAEGSAPAERGPFVLATVRGDIHDIGKNIVRLILENYGFRVIDLGRDVPPEQIVSAVLAHSAPLCGLSALMTTTVPAMQETVAALKREAPFCRTVVGGAVLTAEVAAAMGADRYAPDPMEAVRFANEILGGNDRA